MSTNKGVIVPKIEVKIDHLVTDSDSILKAFAHVIIADSFIINGVKVLDVGKGPFFAMPSRKYVSDNEEKHADICHAITKEAYRELRKCVLEAYAKSLEEQ